MYFYPKQINKDVSFLILNILRVMSQKWSQFFLLCLQIQGIKLMVRWLLGVKNNQSKSGNSTLRMLTAILHSDGDLTEQGRMG